MVFGFFKPLQREAKKLYILFIKFMYKLNDVMVKIELKFKLD